MSDADLLLQERHGAVVLLTLNRPHRRNAVTPELNQALAEALDACDADDTVRAVVLTGAGQGFCAGADLAVFQPPPEPEWVRQYLVETYQALMQRFVRLGKPLLAAVNGAAAGAGASMALACDLRVMADDAALVMAFSNIGLVPDAGATWFLARQVGYSRAFEIAVEAKPVPAERCLALGLANRVVPADDLLTETMAWAEQLAQRPTLTVSLTKQTLYRALSGDLMDAIACEADCQARAVASDDHREGVQAFVERRKPTFTGH